jgi:hypothetical protein
MHYQNKSEHKISIQRFQKKQRISAVTRDHHSSCYGHEITNRGQSYF